MRRSATVLLPVLAVSVLAGCGNDDPPRETTATGTTSSASPVSPSAPSASAAPAEGPIERPAPDTCTPVQERADGVYPIAGVGTVTLTRLDNGLSVEARAGDGWSINSSSDEDEADVEFRLGEEDVDFEADLEDDGRLEIEVCDDQD